MENLPRSGLAAPGEVCFSFLERGGEFESSRLLKTAKTAVFASLVRYFYFTPPNFSILSQLFLFLSKPCSLCTKIPHQSAGFLLASRLSTKLGAGGGTRTHTVSLPTDFESVTSTNSITPANPHSLYKPFPENSRGTFQNSINFPKPPPLYES